MAYIWRPVRRLRGKRVISKKWYCRYRDHLGKLRVKVGYVDKVATQQMAARLERDTAFRIEGIPVAGDPVKSPVDLVGEYLKHLAAKGDAQAHVESTEHRLRRILDAAPMLEPARVEGFLKKLRDEEGRSIGTSNGYLTAAKSFARWLDEHDHLPRNPLRSVRPIKSEVGKRRRRCLTDAEFGRLIAIVEGEPVRFGLSGRDRAMLYLLAGYSGLRWSELASLTPESFEGTTVTIQAGFSKNKKTAVLPIPQSIQERLRQWLDTRPPEELLWPQRWENNRCGAAMIRADLQAAAIPVSTASGVVDFHALRVFYISRLCLSGVPLAHASKLARHSNTSITESHYLRLELNDLSQAVNRLSAPPAVRLHEEREAV